MPEIADKQPIIDIKDLGTCFDGVWVHKDLNLTIYPHLITAIIGGSGSGKTTLIHEILMLQPVTEGEIYLLGQKISDLCDDEVKRRQFASQMGMMFQGGALFSALTALENVMFPLQEYTRFSRDIVIDLARLKLKMVGLNEDAYHKYPSQLSGGMLKRVALARTLALDPEIIFLDEPSAGLDPHSGYALDQLILQLKHDLNLSIIMITHDLESIWRIVDEVVYLDDKRVLIHDSVKNAAKMTQHKNLNDFFNGGKTNKDIKLTLGSQP
ncbi:ABC transporter ATP-binding protein [Caedibacter taeniospiralis]|jgi:phospholipid/cholesterol/gamma-HCH transport system ATP-binding protein|uniref:ABC transporter ATP-binding protein n=1 Tax=Caedibacter taeniospiralis TaxID=28907 RepID=UPI0037BE5401